MTKYRIDERSFGYFAPSFKTGLFRRYLSEGGNVLPRGVIWSSSIEGAARAIRSHMARQADDWLQEGKAGLTQKSKYDESEDLFSSVQ